MEGLQCCHLRPLFAALGALRTLKIVSMPLWEHTLAAVASDPAAGPLEEVLGMVQALQQCPLLHSVRVKGVRPVAPFLLGLPFKEYPYAFCCCCDATDHSCSSDSDEEGSSCGDAESVCMALE